MRMIKAEPKPVNVANARWLYPDDRPGVVYGGLRFSSPSYSTITGEYIPNKGGVFDGVVAPEPGMELIQIDGTWYWIK